jgi:hypothetical protein
MKVETQIRAGVPVIDTATPARSSPPRCRRWPRALAGGVVGLGLLGGLISEPPWLWRGDRLPRGPLSPPPRSDSMTAARFGTVVPASQPAAEVRPPAQGQTPVVHAHSTGTALGGTPTSSPRPLASVGRHTASLRPQAVNQPRAARKARVQSPRSRYAPRRPVALPHLMTVRDGAGSAHAPRRAGGVPDAPVALVARQS